MVTLWLFGIGGFCLGLTAGVILMCCLFAGSDADDEQEAYWQGRRDAEAGIESDTLDPAVAHAIIEDDKASLETVP